jgi:hypothetical protein
MSVELKYICVSLQRQAKKKKKISRAFSWRAPNRTRSKYFNDDTGFSSSWTSSSPRINTRQFEGQRRDGLIFGTPVMDDQLN